MKTLWDVPDSMGGSIAGGAVEDTSSGVITLAIMVSGLHCLHDYGDDYEIHDEVDNDDGRVDTVEDTCSGVITLTTLVSGVHDDYDDDDDAILRDSDVDHAEDINIVFRYSSPGPSSYFLSRKIPTDWTAC